MLRSTTPEVHGAKSLPGSATRAASPRPRPTGPRSTSSSRRSSRPGADIALALDVAASESFEDGYAFEGTSKSAEEMIDYYDELVEVYPLVSIEDPLNEEDWDSWKRRPLRSSATTSSSPTPSASAAGHLDRHRERPAGQGQIGTLAETLDAMTLAQSNGYRCMMSHRSGETEDVTIADLAVATNCGQIKTGAGPVRATVSPRTSCSASRRSSPTPRSTPAPVRSRASTRAASAG